ncbi:lymphocyte cytosolic protein 2a isoform X2 [Stegastes partitus]|uniref:Lymphocyte cytosolic protein 2a isoform X2 n=1 Tax=Stegastes partitus TaxID=144197 RepID=A0A9Y4JKY3_9TELE|nr:PREDICTED: lymphocyte cytosolic protein 2 isoform X2 [Stegastes partitus]
MSSDQVPTRLEVMGWNSQQLAGYLRMMNLSGCDKVVLKNSISGSRFVNLTDNDLQKFPKLHVPMITKISREISKKEKKRGWSEIVLPTKHHEPDVGGWGEDEFDDCDNDYESPCSGDEEGSGGDYESPNDDVDPANDYEPPPSEPQEDLAASLCSPLPIGDGDYIDNRERGLPPAPCPRPSPSTLSPRMPGESASRRDHSPIVRTAGNFPPGVPPPVIRTDKPSNNKSGNKPVNKPGRDSGSNPSPIRGPHRNTLVAPPDSQSRRPHSDATDAPSWHKPLVPSGKPIGRSASSARPSPNRFDGRREQTPDEGSRHNTSAFSSKSLPPRPGPPHSRPEDRSSLPHKLPSGDRPSFRPPLPTAAKELDPRWYVGKVTRGQAEGCLKRVRKDGAYLVRDSTKQQANQPFTLMVFYQDKVYNIQIRQQNQQFQLGTGLKVQESFPSVGDIVNHYSQSPLLLIDAKNRSSGQQNQCQLCDPAGYHMTGQNWS